MKNPKEEDIHNRNNYILSALFLSCSRIRIRGFAGSRLCWLFSLFLFENGLGLLTRIKSDQFLGENGWGMGREDGGGDEIKREKKKKNVPVLGADGEVVKKEGYWVKGPDSRRA